MLAAHLVYLEALDRVTDVLGAAGVPVIALKGAAFVDTLYALGERPMSDIDILIPHANRATADERLCAAGLRRRPAPPGRKHSYEHHYNWGYEHGEVLIEVHINLAQPGRYQIDFDALWDRSRVVTSETRSVRTLCPEDTVIYLAIHQAKHWLREGPNDLGDLTRIIARWQPDWDIVIDRAKRWGATATLSWSLAHAAARGVAVPAPVLDELRPALWRRAGFGLLARWPRSDRGYQLASVLATVDRPVDGARFLARYAAKRVRDLAP